MESYKFYDKIYTSDDLMFYNNNTLSQSLSINNYLEYKKNENKDRKSTRLNSSHSQQSRMPSSA